MCKRAFIRQGLQSTFLSDGAWADRLCTFLARGDPWACSPGKIFKFELLNGRKFGLCTCSHATATWIKGLPTGTLLRAQSEFRYRNGWKYKIRCRFISYKFRCRKFPAARCRLSPFRSPRVTISRLCHLSEFTPHKGPNYVNKASTHHRHIPMPTAFNIGPNWGERQSPCQLICQCNQALAKIWHLQLSNAFPATQWTISQLFETRLNAEWRNCASCSVTHISKRHNIIEVHIHTMWWTSIGLGTCANSSCIAQLLAAARPVRGCKVSNPPFCWPCWKTRGPGN